MLQAESHAHKSWLPKFTFNGRPIFNCALVVQIWRANGRANSPGSTKSRPQFWPSKFSRGMGGQSSPSLVAHHVLPTMVAQNFWQPIYHALCTSTKPTAIWLSTSHHPHRHATVSISFCASPPREERKSMRDVGARMRFVGAPCLCIMRAHGKGTKKPLPKGERLSRSLVISFHSAFGSTYE